MYCLYNNCIYICTTQKQTLNIMKKAIEHLDSAIERLKSLLPSHDGTFITINDVELEVVYQCDAIEEETRWTPENGGVVAIYDVYVNGVSIIELLDQKMLTRIEEEIYNLIS